MTRPSRAGRSSSGSHARPTASISYFGLTDQGRTRLENEDAWFADAKQGLFVVSDGMGGACAGKLASRVVVEFLPPLVRRQMAGVEDRAGVEAKRRLKSALGELSTQVRNRTLGQVGLDGMGATVVLALVRGARAFIAHMGDSRAYRYRKGSLEQLTKDHSLAQLLVEYGEIASGAAQDHPSKNRLTRYVGMKGEPLPVVRSVGLRPGDRLLLCTDGLTAMVPDTELFAIFKQELSPKTTCECLVTAANEAGGRDNITAVVVGIACS